MAIKYPTWKVRGSPTPYDTIYICDYCGTANWLWESQNPVTCFCKTSGKNRRMRKGTKKEHEEANKSLKKII